jgi:hypothetical protein
MNKRKNQSTSDNWAYKNGRSRKIQIPDNSEKIAVRIDERTIILVKKGTDIEAIKQKYAK